MKQPTIQQARAALDRAKLRGRIDEIRKASGALAGAVSHERATVRKAPALAARAVVDQLREIAARPALTPAQRGAQTRKLRKLERQAQAAQEAAARQAALLAPPQAAALVDTWRRLQPGRECFGHSYLIVNPCSAQSERVFWYGCDVSATIEDGGWVAQYRWTGRALTPQNAKLDLAAVKGSYGRNLALPDEEDPDPCRQWELVNQFALEQARKGRDFGLLIAVVRQ